MMLRKIFTFFLAVLLCLPIFFVSPVVDAKKLESSEKTALKVAEEGIVLLKNENQCLPFPNTTKIGLTGKGRRTGYVPGGNGSGWVNTNSIINPYVGIFNAASRDKKFDSVTVMNSVEETGYDKVVYVIARPSTEGEDRKAIEDDYYLSAEEKNDISALMKIYPDDLVVVLNVAGVIDTTWLLQQNVPAIILLGLAGATGGTALANVLSGVVSPSGKLVDTWASSYDDYLSSANFSQPLVVNYYEDIFVGYRQFETFDPTYEKVNFEFGFGLSYTDFQITTDSVTYSDGKAKLSVTVKNIGDTYSGKEVVQVYYSAPDGIYGNPGKELAAFVKTSLLAPGESQTLDISFDLNDMASYDDTGKVKKSAWVLEKGEYSIYVGNSIKNAGQNGKVGTYSVAENIIVEECSTYGTTIDKRLLSNGIYEEFVKENVVKIKEHKIAAYGMTYIPANEFSDIGEKGLIESHYHGLIEHKTLGYLEKDSYITYSLDVEKAGEYSLVFSIASDGERNDSFDIYLNGSKLENKISSTGMGWYDFRPSSPGKINLPKGKSELKIVCKETVNISHMCIYNSNVSPDGKTVMGSGSVIGVSSKNNACMTDGIVTMTGSTGKALLDVYVEKAGEYFLSINYSNVSDAAENAISVKVNSTKLDDGFDIMKTGYDTSVADQDQLLKFKESGSLPITLEEGKNTIMLTSKGIAGYIDSVIINTVKNEVSFEDNTSSFPTFDLYGKTLEKFIKYQDVYKSFADADKENDLLDEFVSQFSILEMASMAGIYRELANPTTGTGGYGSPDAPESLGTYGLYPVSTADGPAGIRSVNDEIFTYMPCATVLASTWNVTLAFEFGKAIGAEGFEAGVEIWLAPGVNIHRNPLCGRNFEYLSEDPYLTGIMASQIINGCQSQGVACSIKHLAANNKEYNRHNSNSVLSERALREIYLKGFEIAVKNSSPITIMTSYNLINGVETAHDSALLEGIVRKEWGFDGVFVSDWYNNINHTLSILGGNTIMSDNPDEKSVVKAYCAGNISREKLEENTKYIIRSMLKMSEGGIKNNIIPSDGKSFTAENFSFETGNAVVSEQGVKLNNSNDLYYSVVIEKAGFYGMGFKLLSEKEFNFDVYVDSEKYISSTANSASKDTEYSFGKEKTVYLSEGVHNILISVNSGELYLSEIAVCPAESMSNVANLTDGGFSSVKDSVYVSVNSDNGSGDDDSSDDTSADISDESADLSQDDEASDESQGQVVKSKSGSVVFIVIFALIAISVAVSLIAKKEQDRK